MNLQNFVLDVHLKESKNRSQEEAPVIENFVDINEKDANWETADETDNVLKTLKCKIERTEDLIDNYCNKLNLALDSTKIECKKSIIKIMFPTQNLAQ